MRACLVSVMVMIALSTLGAAPEFEEGQVWAYKTRPGEEGSTLLINKIEDHPKLGHIYHISLSKVRFNAGAGAITDQMPHLPVSKQTLELSCTQLVGRSEPNPMYLPGYRMWKQAFDAGRAGIYTISIAEILDLSEKVLQKQAPTT